MPHLEVQKLCSSYGRLQVLSDIDLRVEKGEVVSLIGPSGSGKSTLLRTLIGLTMPTSGATLVDGLAIDYRSPASVRKLRERMAIVFQQYNLFQNMDVLRNVTISPIKVQRRPRSEVEKEAAIILARVGLSEKHHAYPDQLSGGQQQRVAIARALTLKPQILLLDEVTSALDPELVTEVLDTIRGLAREGMTMLIVSHEMGFVREVSTRVVMMDKGRVVETGTPATIFNDAQEARTRDFVGKVLRHH